MNKRASIANGAPGFDVEAMIASAREASAFLKALAHEGRLLILCLLSEGEKTVTELEAMLALRQSAVSQQLARLRIDGLVETRREGKNIFYSLARPDVSELIGVLHRTFCPQSAPRIANRHPAVRGVPRRPRSTPTSVPPS